MDGRPTITRGKAKDASPSHPPPASPKSLVVSVAEVAECRAAPDRSRGVAVKG